MADYDFRLGRTPPQLANIEEAGLIGLPPHPWTFRAGSVRYVAGNGFTYYDGYGQASWHFDFITNDGWENLMALFEDTESVFVTVRTKINDGTYETFLGIMHRPLIGDEVERGVGGWFNIDLRFTHLEVLV